MYFVKTEGLKVGMRIARPVYSSQGYLLLERNAKLTEQAIQSIQGFGIIGMYILEPTEPMAEMTEEEVEFERFQAIMVSMIAEEMDTILEKGRAPKATMIVEAIIKEYGHRDKKIDFISNVRSREDFIYKHALNTAILCALVTNRMNVKVDERRDAVAAAVFGGIGRLEIAETLADKVELTANERARIHSAQTEGFEQLGSALSDGVAIKRICTQAEEAMYDFYSEMYTGNEHMLHAAKVLIVADTFERMTAMTIDREPESVVKAIKYLKKYPEIYDADIVQALIDSLNFLHNGVSVELNTGERALIIAENEKNVLRPVVLSFKDNVIMDLSCEEYDDIEIVDTIKTMDNRHVIHTKI